MKTIKELKDMKPVQGIHSALHLFVDEIRKEYGETAKKGKGSFSYYLGFVKRIGLQRAYQIRAEIKSGGARAPKKLFWWHIGQEQKRLKGVNKRG